MFSFVGGMWDRAGYGMKIPWREAGCVLLCRRDAGYYEF